MLANRGNRHVSCRWRWCLLAVVLATGCAPNQFVIRKPGLEVMRPGISVKLTDRDGDPTRGPTRYSVALAHSWAPRAYSWTIVRAYPGTSATPCAAEAVPLPLTPESPLLGDHGLQAFGIAVAPATGASALDLVLDDRAGQTPCLRIPVEGEDVVWRRVHPAAGLGVGLSVVAPTTTLRGTTSLSVAELRASEWWGIVRGTASLGLGTSNCAYDVPSCPQPPAAAGTFAMTAAATVDAHASLFDVVWLGLGARYAAVFTADNQQTGVPLLHGLYAVPGLIYGTGLAPSVHGLSKRPTLFSVEVAVPVGFLTTTPGSNWAHSLAIGGELSASLTIDER